MFPPKKKNPIGGAMAPQKPGLGSPLPVEKAGMADSEELTTEGPPDAPEAAPQEGEPPSEGGENYGAKIQADIEEVGKRYGADPETARSLAADFFEAMARCFKGGDEQETPMEAGGETDEGGGY